VKNVETGGSLLKYFASEFDSTVIKDLLIQVCEKSQAMDTLNAQDVVRDLVKQLELFYQQEKTI